MFPAVLRVTYQELFDVLLRALLELGFETERAALCARLFADTDRDGGVAFDPSSFDEAGAAARVADQIIESIRQPAADGGEVRYPGERTLETRRRNLEEGIPVEPSVWEQVQSL